MARHKLDLKKYREALARMDRHGAEAAELIARNAERADLHPEKRKQVKSIAIGETRDRLGTEYRKIMAMYETDKELAQAAALPDVTAGNVAERTYWQQHAQALLADAPPDTVPTVLRRELIKANPVARSEMLRAAEGRMGGANWETRQQFTQLRNRYMTDAERAQRADAAAMEAVGTRLGFLARSVENFTKDLEAIDPAYVGQHYELPSGARVSYDAPRAAVIHPQHFEITANGIEAEAERYAENAWAGGRTIAGDPPAPADAPDAA